MSRPALIERRTYEPALPVEEFVIPLLKQEIESVLQALPIDTSDYRVLDMGCGGQPFRSFFERRGYTYVSADAQDPLGIVDYMMELDKDVPAELLEAGPFDFILCSEVMEHVADWDRAFKNLAVLLRPGGRLLVTCPHLYILHEQPYDFWRPTIYALKYFGERYDLRPVQIRMAGCPWDILGTILGANLRSVRPRRRTLPLRVMARALEILIGLVYEALRRRWLQRHFLLGSASYPLYHCNVALFERLPAISRPKTP